MNWIENSLNQIESTLRAIFEGKSGADVPRKFHNQLLGALDSAMQAGRVKLQQVDSSVAFDYAAPDLYTLIMPEAQAKILLAHPAELDKLAHKLAANAAQAHILLGAAPILRVVASPDDGQLNIHADFSHAGVGDSYTTELEELPLQPRASGDGTHPKAFLIVNGLETYLIVHAVTNIGSAASNHLVLNDPSISPQHAQLRLINNHFTIFDLDSKGGTYVNGVLIARQVLDPGDVILLSGVPLVYGQETPPHSGHTQKLDANWGKLEVL